MTELLTSSQMRTIEQVAIENGKITGLELMERAGQGVLNAVFNWRPDLASGTYRAVVMCGPGNNGGDGYVIARLLSEIGWDIDVFALTSPKTRDAQEMARRWGGRAEGLTRDALYDSKDADLYIDAIFGTGLTRAPKGDLLELLRHLAGSGGDNEFFRQRLVAVDAPSGLCLDSGRALDVAGLDSLPATGLTVTFECPKIGHFIGDGPEACGQLEVVDLGLADWRGLDHASDMKRTVRPAKVQLIDQKTWAAPCPNDRIGLRLAVTKRQGHKFNHGHALVVSGGFARTGASRLAARAALRVGAGLVTVAAPTNALPECAAQLTAIMLREADTADELAALLDDTRITSVCIGPGLGLGAAESNKVAVVLKSRKACVLDADALTLIGKSSELRALLHDLVVLTPHMGEFARLCPDIAQRLQAAPSSGPAYSKVDAARDAAVRLGCCIVLKGFDTVIADPRGFSFVHSASYDRNAPWLATAGSGDVLAGFITGELAKFPQFVSQQASRAVWLHAEAARCFGPGLIAEDISEQLPAVLSQMSAPV